MATPTEHPLLERAPTPVRDVPTRRLSFAETFADVPRHFAADGDLLKSHFAATLSAVFPDGEDFFVRSVRHYRDRITDTELRRQVAGFIGQESVHGREHRAFNERLAELGYPTRAFERLTRGALRLRERLAPARSNLAATAALEHYTATFAEALLSDPELYDSFGNDAVRNLFLWHAVEESEHKAVAFDVYRAVGGTERMRRIVMNLTTVGFVVGITVMMVVSLLSDPATYHPRRLWRSWREFRRFPLLQREVRARIREYQRPGFHPDDRDSTELLERWRAELFGQSGTLRPLLKGVA
jgi:predicted metal-dependent hydrolase